MAPTSPAPPSGPTFQRMESEMQCKEEKLIQDMADAMRRYGDGCTSEELNRHFTQSEIARYGARARARAYDQAVRQIRKRAA